MKNTIKNSAFIAISLFCVSCTDLTEIDQASFNAANFPSASNPQSYQVIALDPIAHLRQMLANQATWEVHETVTDECVVPTRGSDWFDGNRWKDFHFHDFKSDNNRIITAWNWAYFGISKSNSALKVLEQAAPNATRDNYIGQVRAVRAYFYWHLIDLFGNVPIVTKPDLSEGLPKNSTRADVFKFIEKELLEAEKVLSTDVNALTYGLPTKWFAKALLTKLYLNAEVYTGTAKWDEAAKQAEEIMTSGKYNYTDDYLSIFAFNNGPTIKENIFVIAQSANDNASVMQFPQKFLPKEFGNSVDYKAGAWAGYSALPEFYDTYNDPKDQRNKQWFVGPQNFSNGQPVMAGSKQVVITKEMPFGKANPANPFDLGGCLDCYWQGVKNMKYGFDPLSASSLQSNDFVVFRYSDIVLMKAEAEARKANNPEIALIAVNQLRAKRGAAAFTKLTWDTFLEERGREFAYEMWRRNDLIRFGAWGKTWGLKPNTVSKEHLKLFPIPLSQLQSNSNLKQNPGY